MFLILLDVLAGTALHGESREMKCEEPQIRRRWSRQECSQSAASFLIYFFFFSIDDGDSEPRNLPREERRMQQSQRKIEEAEHKENGNGDSGEGGTKLVEEEEEEEVEREKSARVLREATGVCSSRWSNANTSERERPKNVGWRVGVVAGGDMLETEEQEERVVEEEEEDAKRAAYYESRSNRASIVREMKVVACISPPLNLTELSIYTPLSVEYAPLNL
jgi:hypothetical protein